MRFSINTLCLFPGQSMEACFRLLRAHGFSTYELWRLDRATLPELAKLQDQYGMTLSTGCPPFFTLNSEDCHDRYEKELRDTIADLHALNSHTLITQVGNDNGQPRAQQHAAIVKGLRRMAPILEENGVTLMIEPLNDVKDHKGYYLTGSAEGFDIVREVGSPKVRLLYDVYHQVHMGEDPLKEILPNLPLIAHFHIAGHPNRDEKLWERYDYAPLLRALKESGTEAPIGVELFPSSQTAAEALLDELKKFE